MTLILLFIVMSMVNAHWAWYVLVFILWCIRLTFKVTSGIILLAVVADANKKNKETSVGR